MSKKMDVIFSFADDVKAREEEFGLLVVSKSTPALSLNHDSEYVWNLIDGKRNVYDILSIMKEDYQEEHLEELLIQTLDSLHKLGLIKIVEGKA